MTRRGWLWMAIVVGTLLSAIVSYRVAHLSFVFGSKEGRWTYEYIYGFNPRTLVLSLAAFMACGAPLLLPAAVVRRRAWWLLAYVLVAGTFVQLRLRTLAPYTIARMFESDGSNGYYGATRQYRASELLKDFERLRTTLTIHPRSNMPGKLALVYALERVSTEPATLAVLTIVLSNLGSVALYLLVLELTDDALVALTSVVFYLFVPARLFFFPILNTVTPALVFGCLYLWVCGLRMHSRILSILLGAALYGLTVFEPLPLVTGVLFAGLAFSAIAKRDVDPGGLMALTVAAATSYVVTAITIQVWLHFDTLAVLRHLMREAVAFNAAAPRPYSIWVWRNLLDFSIGAGLTQSLLFVTSLFPVRAPEPHRRRWTDVWRDPMAVFTGALAISIVITDLLGVNRGESVRLWIFFACLLQIPAAYSCVRLRSRLPALATLAASIVIGSLGTSMMTFAQP
jgi:hypothetical protein